MEKGLSSDIARMAKAIEAEAELRIKEIADKAEKCYSRKKAEYVEMGMIELEKELERKKKEISKEREQRMGKIRIEYKKKIQKIKEELLLKIIEKIKEKVKNERIDETYIKESEKHIQNEKNTANNMIIYCMEKDKKSVEEYYKDKSGVIIREMQENGLGGLIIACQDGKMVADNSYRTRMEVYSKTKLNIVSRFIKELLIKL